MNTLGMSGLKIKKINNEKKITTPRKAGNIDHHYFWKYKVTIFSYPYPINKIFLLCLFFIFRSSNNLLNFITLNMRLFYVMNI